MLSMFCKKQVCEGIEFPSCETGKQYIMIKLTSDPTDIKVECGDEGTTIQVLHSEDAEAEAFVTPRCDDAARVNNELNQATRDAKNKNPTQEKPHQELCSRKTAGANKNCAADLQCPVCLDHGTEDDFIILAPCGHMLCKEHCGHNSRFVVGKQCPLCRCEIVSKVPRVFRQRG